MAESSVNTSYTNASITRIALHANMRDVEADKNLRDKVLRDGQGPRGRPLRFLVRQPRATRNSWGGRFRLFGWLYIRKQEPADIMLAVAFANQRSGKGKGAGKLARPSVALTKLGPLEKQHLRTTLAEDPIYHVVIRGNDPMFIPPQSAGCGQDVVTNYFVTGMNELCDHLTEKINEIFEAPEQTGETPVECFRTLLGDAGFVTCLEEFFRLGDMTIDRNLKLAGRLGGTKCLAHRAIKENDIELLHELLLYTAETTADRPWLRFSEPLLQLGPYHLSAFHRAVYDGRPECLRLLLNYAKDHGHLATVAWELENREDRQWQAENEGRDGMTILEMAEAKGNDACYNVIVDFAKSTQDPRAAALTHKGGVDRSLRDHAFVELLAPRIEVVANDGQGLRHVERREVPSEISWPDFCSSLLEFIREAVAKRFEDVATMATAAPTGLVSVAIHNIRFLGVGISEEEARALLTGAVLAVEEGNGNGLRKHVLAHFWFRACRTEAAPGEAAQAFIRAIFFASGSDAGGPLTSSAAGRVRFVFGFIPWHRGIAAPAVEDGAEAAGGLGDGGGDACILTPRPEGDGAQGDAETRVMELGHAYYRRVICLNDVSGADDEVTDEPLRDVDFWAVYKLIMDRVTSSPTKWLWATLSNMAFPERFLLKHSRKLGQNSASGNFSCDEQNRDMASLLADEDGVFRIAMESQNSPLTLWNLFWDLARLIFAKPDNPAENLEPEAILFIEFMLRGWFAGFASFARQYEASAGGTASNSKSLWVEFWKRRFLRHTGDQAALGTADGASIFETVAELLRLALDKAVASLVRMDGVLEFAYQRVCADPANFLERRVPAGGTAGEGDISILRASWVGKHDHVVAWLRALVPAALDAYFGLTVKAFKKLEKYYD